MMRVKHWAIHHCSVGSLLYAFIYIGSILILLLVYRMYLSPQLLPFNGMLTHHNYSVKKVSYKCHINTCLPFSRRTNWIF